jgi:hypothetical protein
MCRFKMSRFRAPSKTSARRNDGPSRQRSRPRSRQDGPRPRRQRSRPDGPSRPGRRLDARNQRQGHRNRDLPAATPVRRRTAGQPPDLLACLKGCRPRRAPPPWSFTDRVFGVDHRSGRRRSVRTPGGPLLRRSRDAHRRAVFLACPRFFLVLPRARAAFPLALCDLRPVTFPTTSSTRPTSRSTAPSVLLRRALLNTVLPRLFTGAPGVGTVGDSSARWPTPVAATRTRG